MPGIRISSSTWQQESQDYLELGAFRCVLLRLRAAMSIARLWQGRRNEAANFSLCHRRWVAKSGRNYAAVLGRRIRGHPKL